MAERFGFLRELFGRRAQAPVVPAFDVTTVRPGDLCLLVPHARLTAEQRVRLVEGLRDIHGLAPGVTFLVLDRSTFELVPLRPIGSTA